MLIRLEMGPAPPPPVNAIHLTLSPFELRLIKRAIQETNRARMRECGYSDEDVNTLYQALRGLEV